jgi:seryl-tRNA synthetase
VSGRATTHADVTELPGLTWRTNGQCVLSGPLLAAARSLDAALTGLGKGWGCEEFRFPPFLPAVELERVDYFAAFPHLATFPVTLASDAQTLQRFAADAPLGADASVVLPALGPVRDVLTPAACYHFYVHLQGESLSGPRYLTTRATCFRNESTYRLLERQSAFSMRELVCVGTADEVMRFVTAIGDQVDHLLATLDLAVEWQRATDPFFQPARNGSHLMQLLDPVKFEAVHDGVAIASTNRHHDHFGAAFVIERGGRPAHSGCVAFGIERWLLALSRRYGPDPSRWPAIPEPGAVDD